MGLDTGIQGMRALRIHTPFGLENPLTSNAMIKNRPLGKPLSFVSSVRQKCIQASLCELRLTGQALGYLSPDVSGIARRAKPECFSVVETARQAGYSFIWPRPETRLQAIRSLTRA